MFRLLSLFYLFMVLCSVPTFSANKTADIVLKHVTLVEPKQGNQTATLIISDGKIKKYPADKPLDKHLITANTQVIDASHYYALPGIIESHGHLVRLGQSLDQLNLANINDFNAVLKAIKQQVQLLKPGQWLVGRGWDQNLWQDKRFPTRQQLDKISPQNPIALTRIDGHAMWVNSAALRLATITTKTPDPIGGKVIRDANGDASGILVDTAMQMVSKQLANPSLQQKITWTKKAISHLHRLGVTSFHDAGTSRSDLEAFTNLRKQNDLSLRIYVMLAADDRSFLQEHFKRGPSIDPEGLLTVRSVKLVADGALGSRAC